MYQTHLLRRSYREDGKVKHETLGNLSHLPPDLIDTIRGRLRGDMPPAAGEFEIVRSLPHGHVPVTIGQTRVCPGDLLRGDADGVVVIPRSREEEVLSAAETIDAAEQRIRETVQQGKRLDEARVINRYHTLQGRDEEGQ